MGSVVDAFTGKSEKKAARKQERAAEVAAGQQEALQREAIAAREAATEKAIAGFQPFIADDPGAALNRLRALTGAAGAGAQQQAFQSFQEGPGVAFARERGLRGIDRDAAAIGGLGGGNRLKALTEFSQGLALQDLQRQLGNLAGVAQQDIGLQQDIGNLQTGLGAAQASGLSQIGRIQATGTQQAAGFRAQGILGQAEQIRATRDQLAGIAGFGAGGGFGGGGGVGGGGRLPGQIPPL